MSFRHRLIIPSAYLTIGMCGVFLSMYQISLLRITQTFEVNTLMMGVLIGTFYVGICLTPLLLGSQSERLGKRGVLAVSLPLMILGAMLAGFAGSVTMFIISVFLIGAGFSVTEATMSAVLGAEFPATSKFHLGMSQAFFSAGAVAAPFISEALFSAGKTHQDLFFYTGFIFIALYLLFWFTQFQNDIKGQSNAHLSSAARSFRSSTFVLLAAAIFFCVGIEEIIAFFADSYFELTLHSPEFSALALTLFWAGMIPSRFFLGAIRLSHKAIVLICAAGTIACALLIALLPALPAKLALYGLLGLFCGPTWPLVMDLTAKRYPKNVGFAVNIMMSVSGLGGALVPLIVSAFIVGADFTPIFFAAALCALAIAVAFVFIRRKAANKTLENGS